MPAAIPIFLFTLVLLIWQSRGLGIGWSASFGAVLALVFGVVHLADIAVVSGIIWNATASFVAVILINLLLDEAGFFFTLPTRDCADDLVERYSERHESAEAPSLRVNLRSI